MKLVKTDIAIIGAGPVGLFAVFQAGMLNLNSVVIENLKEIGGQCTALYPEKPIYDIPAYTEITAGALVQKLMEQIAPFKPEFLLNQQAISLNKNTDQDFIITTSSGTQVLCKAVIIAAGGGVLAPNRPGIPNIEKFENHSIYYSVTNSKIFENKRVAIAGGGDSAIDWAISLSNITSKLYLIHRREKFRAAPISMAKIQQAIQEERIELIAPYQLHALHGLDSELDSVDVIDLSGNVKNIKVDYLLPFFGLSMNLGPLVEWGFEIDNKHIKVDPATMESNIEKIFAIGDIVQYPGKLKLILTGFAEAALACNSAHKAIFPNLEIHFEHSTSKGIPGKL